MSKKLYEEVGGLNIDQYSGKTGVEVQLTKGLEDLIHLTEGEVRQVVSTLKEWLGDEPSDEELQESSSNYPVES